MVLTCAIATACVAGSEMATLGSGATTIGTIGCVAGGRGWGCVVSEPLAIVPGAVEGETGFLGCPPPEPTVPLTPKKSGCVPAGPGGTFRPGCAEAICVV